MSSYSDKGYCAQSFARKCEQTEYKQMRYDDSYTVVEPEKARSFIRDASKAGIPKGELWKLRKKYDAYLCDPIKRTMDEFGLNYYDHYVEWGSSGLMINGYSSAEWRMLVDDEHFPGLQRVSRFINKCRADGDDDALAVLETKYGSRFGERAKEILESHGLPADTKYDTITCRKINGVSFLLWRMMHDDSFVPPKAILRSELTFLRKSGRFNEIDCLLNKYDYLLNPVSCQLPTEKEIVEADEYFRHLHDHLLSQL